MTKGHPLDRPVWNSLTSRQAFLSLGDARALRLAPDYGFFAAAADGSDESLAALAAFVPAKGAVATVGFEEPGPPPGVGAQQHVVWQMTALQLTEAATSQDFEIVPLTVADAPQMLALARLTQPGPFFSRTNELGDFVGVKAADGALLAMAGERMKLIGFTEVSGVCCDPNHRSRGYAGTLSRVVAERILSRGETPFLHVYSHNKGAIGLYEQMGFSLRCEVIMTLLTRP